MSNDPAADSPQPPARVRVDEAAARAVFEQAMASHHQAFGTFFLAKLLGLEITYPEGCCVIEMEVRDFLFNPQGSLHGGILSTVLDISMGHLLRRVAGFGMTLEMKVQFMRPVREGRIRCEASFVKQGRSINYLQSRLSDAEGRLIAMATSTWQLMPQAGSKL